MCIRDRVYTVLDNQFHTLANLVGRLCVESGNGYNKVGGYQQQKQEYENFLYHLLFSNPQIWGT